MTDLVQVITASLRSSPMALLSPEHGIPLESTLSSATIFFLYNQKFSLVLPGPAVGTNLSHGWYCSLL